MALTAQDIDLLEDWWINKSRSDFLTYRKYMRPRGFKFNWFVVDLCTRLQQFFEDVMAGKSPVLFIQAPPQHGKSWAVTDLLAWISGKAPWMRIIYASFSDLLGIRCNTQLQRFFDSEKHQKVFPTHRISSSNVVTLSTRAKRNSNLIEYIDENGHHTDGQFRNTTVAGPITGESLDIGVIDDAVKGRENANSLAWSTKIWQWFTDDFMTRFSELGGLLVVMTRWSTHDIIARCIENYKAEGIDYTLVNYPALATKDEPHRRAGEPLFPELKSKKFLLRQKAVRSGGSWDSLFQGNPSVVGGDLFKDEWWKWWKKVTPQIKYKFITADTAQKENVKNDWTVFQCWGYGVDGRIYLLDKKRARMNAPTLRREAEIFYRDHDSKKENLTDPILRAMYIEDKSSGTGLIQELRALNFKVVEVPRNKDKNMRAEDASVYIQAGLVVLNTEIEGIGNLTSEAQLFPNGEFDDDIDTLITAVEVAFINKNGGSDLLAAMGAD